MPSKTGSSKLILGAPAAPDQTAPAQTAAGQPSLARPVIRSIRIVIKPIFDTNKESSVYGYVNHLKFSTREYVIRRELFLTEGDTYDEFRLSESLRNLRSLKYIREASIEPTFDGEYVDIVVTVQDTWTTIPQFSFSSGDGRDKLAAGLVDSNLLGLGKRAEVVYRKDQDTSSVEGVWDDQRLFGSDLAMLVGTFQREDGEAYFGSLGRPARSLLESTAWITNGGYNDTIGRLWENGDERYIYRNRGYSGSGEYTISDGTPDKDLSRYSLGWSVSNEKFFQADLKDYEDLDLDPGEVSNDIDDLPDNRRFSGPTFRYSRVLPHYISMNYIDRFEYVQDYNLGPTTSLFTNIAPEFFGSDRDTLLFSLNRSEGIQFDSRTFLRGEAGASSRLEENGFKNSLVRTELKFYRVLDTSRYELLNFAQHTFATGFQVEYGNDFDRDRELLSGADYGLRGYKARTFTGDKRFILNVEDRMHIAEDVLQLFNFGAAVFADAGGSTYDSLGDLFAKDAYADIGFGLRFGFPRATGNRVLRIDIAFPLRDGPDDSNAFEPRFLITGGQAFNSQLRSEAVGAEKASVEVGFDR